MAQPTYLPSLTHELNTDINGQVDASAEIILNSLISDGMPERHISRTLPKVQG